MACLSFNVALHLIALTNPNGRLSDFRLSDDPMV